MTTYQPFLAILALAAGATAGVVPVQQVYQAAAAPVVYDSAVHAPVAHVQPVHDDDDYFDPHPQYMFGYNVHDAQSGDSKAHVEQRDGDVVRGEYSLIDADGYKRTVTYTVDSGHGFNAVVQREPLEHVPTVVKPDPTAYTSAEDYSSSAGYHKRH